jgi:hypothetical protein
MLEFHQVAISKSTGSKKKKEKGKKEKLEKKIQINLLSMFMKKNEKK